MTTVYAVGDIHGQARMLGQMLELIADDAEGRSGDKLAVFLGDYIDRGPESREVVGRLMSGPLPFPSVCLMGNHEDLAVNGPHHVWLMNGGTATLNSYGGEIQPEHLEWMRGLPVSHRVGKWLFVHAGVDPTLPLDQQDRRSMIWIRAKFLMHEDPYEGGTVVVHGHTPNEDPEIEPNRINLDTGATFGGALSCAVLTDRLERVIQVKAA